MSKFEERLKFLADVNVERGIIELLRNLGFEVQWVADLDKFMEDEQVLKLAAKESRILLTNDKDFGQLVFRQKKEVGGVILFRVKGQDTGLKKHLLKRLLEGHEDKLKGYFVVVTEDKFRFAPIRG